ncbi:recombination-associated protein RdgC [Aliidiomarina minuta]|uniref:Recombination-associated protein RdgC n=1 Tax=Aliidiomarina minuta TaxID=880057 RepID=A0A432W4J3_9GAMM|nr:recombination-associated protein RdgC [Aliidiomarina minuta]RUO24421.1 recombination-associated protein RdgC [Aliidiomarina minuta]
MWFKNLRVYTFSQPFTAPADFDSQLASYAFSPCQRHQSASFGFVSPFGDGSEVLHHKTGSNILLCTRKEEKVLPASAIQAQIEEHAEKYAEEHGRPLPKKEKQALKEDIIHQMLPQAFSRFSQMWAYIDVEGQRLIVDSSASGKAEDFTALLRGALGSLPVKPWGAPQPGDLYFTQWLQDKSAPTPFVLGTDAELKGTGEEAAVVRLKQQDLVSAEIQSHLEHDKVATKLGLEWEEHMSLVLEDDFAIKRLKFSDIIKEQNDDMATSTKAEQIDADFALMSLECNQLLDALQATWEESVS